MCIFDLFRGRNFRESGTFDKYQRIYFHELGANSQKFLQRKFLVAKISSLKLMFCNFLLCKNIKIHLLFDHEIDNFQMFS